MVSILSILKPVFDAWIVYTRIFSAWRDLTLLVGLFIHAYSMFKIFMQGGKCFRLVTVMAGYFLNFE